MDFLLEWLLRTQQWQITVNMGEAHTMLPGIVSWVSTFILLILAIKPLRRRLLPQLS